MPRERAKAAVRALLRPLFRRVPIGLLVDIHVKPGHYYSPIPDPLEVRARSDWIFDRDRVPEGIDLNEATQLETLGQIESVYGGQPFSDDQTGRRRYFFSNGWFSHADGLTLYGILRNFPVRRFIEAGSGYSSALALDVNELFMRGALQCTFVDPYPGRLTQVLRREDRDRAQIIAKPVQDVELALFEGLESGDILFIDCSHVSKTGSDVNHLFFEVLPRLREGVLVHIHDIFWPFEYPEQWILGEEHRAWNEAYLTRAFLQYNSGFEILFWGSCMEKFHEDRIAETMPIFLKSPASSLWLRKAA